MKLRLVPYLLTLVSFFSVLSADATVGPENISKAMGALCATLQGALAIGMLLLVVLAAIVYAVGQVLGAETRARASVWATAMFTGAIIGAIIYIIVPWILAIIMKGEADSTWVQNCCKSDPDPDCFGIAGTE